MEIFAALCTTAESASADVKSVPKRS